MAEERQFDWKVWYKFSENMYKNLYKNILKNNFYKMAIRVITSHMFSD